MINIYLYTLNAIKTVYMERTIINAKNAEAQNIIKEARKKAIDEGLTFSETVIRLLEKWINNEVRIKKEVRK